MIPKTDEMAALLCDLAAARIRNDREAMRRAIAALQSRGWDAPMEPAKAVMDAAKNEERKARPDVND